MTSPSRYSSASGYHYDPTTGDYTTTQRRPSHSHPPPLPPKELEAGYVTKETQHGFAELEGDLDIGFDEKPASRVVTPHKSKRPAPRLKRKLRVLSLGTCPPPPHSSAESCADWEVQMAAELGATAPSSSSAN